MYSIEMFCEKTKLVMHLSSFISGKKLDDMYRILFEPREAGSE